MIRRLVLASLASIFLGCTSLGTFLGSPEVDPVTGERYFVVMQFAKKDGLTTKIYGPTPTKEFCNTMVDRAVIGKEGHLGQLEGIACVKGKSKADLRRAFEVSDKAFQGL